MFLSNRPSKARGFTLLEVLLAVALMGMIAAFSSPLFLSLQSRSSLNSALSAAAPALRRAQALAQGSHGDSPWGVYAQQGRLTVFQGQSYAERNAALDEVIELSPAILASGLTEAVFAKFSGLPHAEGVLTLSDHGQSATVAITAQGAIHF